MDDNTNKLFEDFKGRDVLDGISADNFDSLKDDAFIVESNKEYFNDLLRTGWLSGQISSSGPMPNTSKIVQIDLTSSSATSGTVFTPAAGEVWQLTGASTGTLNAARAELNLRESSTGTLVEIGAETAAATQFDPTGIGPVYVDNNVDLSYFISGLSGNTTIKVALIRVR